MHFYEWALEGHRIQVQLEDGTHLPLAAELWGRPRVGDDSVIERCHGATLDVGCGAGRITSALASAGVPALGIDISAHAVVLCRRRGVPALQRDVFALSPDIGLWQHVALIDGNIGIGGDAAVLLRRCKDLLCDGGTVIVETSPPGAGCQRLLVRLVHGSISSRPFSWLITDSRTVKTIGMAVGLVSTSEWAVAGRWFVELTRFRPGPVSQRGN